MKKKSSSNPPEQTASSKTARKAAPRSKADPEDDPHGPLQSPKAKLSLPGHSLFKDKKAPKVPFPKAPKVSAKSARKALDDLLRLARALVSKPETLSDLTRPGVGTLVRGLHGGCHHWLPDNRLDWWEAYFDELAKDNSRLSTGPLVKDDEFPCEFNPALGAVVDWESLNDGDDPNTLASSEFTLMTTDPRCRPVVRELELEIDENDVPQPVASHKAVVNCWEDPPPQDINQPRPSLFVTFDRPQRAVGLSFSYIPDANRQGDISSEGVELIAYDIDGQEITRSHGRNLTSNRFNPRWIRGGQAFNRIGVRSRDGAIMYVELRFGYDLQHKDDGPGELVREPQLIYRVWHEPFPSAAVLQGEIEVEEHGHNSETVESQRLPFGCDKAMVFLRGFKAEYPDEPHPMDKLHVEVTLAGISNGSARVRLRGSFHGEEHPDYLLRAYYSLVAWDSQEMELFPVSIHGGVRRSDTTHAVMETIDPCPVPAVLRSLNADVESCRELAHGMTGFLISYPEPSEPEEIFIQADDPQRSGQLSGGSPRVIQEVEFDAPSDDDDEISWRYHGKVLAGPSLASFGHITLQRDALRAAGTEPTDEVILLDEGGTEHSQGTGPRPPKGHDWHFYRTYTLNGVERDLAVTMEADMAFAALGHVMMEVDNEPQQLECEIWGAQYDGRTFQFKRGGGISTEEPTDYDQDHSISFMPTVIGLRRKRQAAQVRLFTRDLRFDGVVEGTFVQEASQTGAIQNRGTRSVLITAGVRSGPHAGDFYVLLAKVARQIRYDNWMFERLERQGDIFSLYDLPGLSPIRLDPGETLIVSANAFIQGGGERRAVVEFTTNDPLMPVVPIDMVARVVESEAYGLLLPEQINYHQVQVGQQRDRNALVISAGPTPLLITDLAMAHNNQGFTFEVFGTYNPPNTYQVNPGEMWPDQYIRIRFEPPGVGVFSTSLNVQTNAGLLQLQLNGEGIN